MKTNESGQPATTNLSIAQQLLTFNNLAEEPESNELKLLDLDESFPSVK